MQLNKFKIIQANYQKQHNLSVQDKFHKEHLLYKELKKVFKPLDLTNFGFCCSYKDDLNFLPIVQDLLVEKKNIYFAEINKSKLLFNKVNSLIDKFNYQNNYLQYENKEYLQEKLDILIIPIQGFKKRHALLMEEEVIEYLKSFSGFKLGFCLKEFEIEKNNPKIDSLLVELNKIIEI